MQLKWSISEAMQTSWRFPYNHLDRAQSSSKNYQRILYNTKNDGDRKSSMAAASRLILSEHALIKCLLQTFDGKFLYL